MPALGSKRTIQTRLSLLLAIESNLPFFRLRLSSAEKSLGARWSIGFRPKRVAVSKPSVDLGTKRASKNALARQRFESGLRAARRAGSLVYTVIYRGVERRDSEFLGQQCWSPGVSLSHHTTRRCWRFVSSTCDPWGSRRSRS